MKRAESREAGVQGTGFWRKETRLIKAGEIDQVLPEQEKRPYVALDMLEKFGKKS